MTSSTFIAIPLKRTYEVDMAGPLQSFIASTYSSADKPLDTDAVNEFQKLRNKAVCTPLDKHETSLDVLYRYHDQLVAIEGKLPISPTAIPITFKWKDAFDKGSLFFGRASLTLSFGGYERACVLFNVAALQSQIAAAQQTDIDDELKLAAKLFQSSAGVLSQLKDCVLSLIQQEPTMDMLPDTLSALSALMLAQAQEAIYLKAAKDQMKPVIVAKIGAHCADLYQDAAKQMSRDTLKSLWERDWLPTIHGKQLAFQALAQYQQSLVSKEKKEIGEELSRLQEAHAKMAQAKNQFGSSSIFRTEIATVQKAYELAKKDNDFIYHERIPDFKSLSVIQKAAVAKPLPPSSPMSTKFKDVFESLVPVAVHQALAAYELRKGEIVNGEIGRIREQTQLLNGLLASLNLPAALDDVCNQETLPESVRDKSSKVKSAGGIQELLKMHSELPALLKRNAEILDETTRVLTEEKTTDDQLRGEYKERWTRMLSEKLTEPLWQEVGKYKQVLDTAKNADNIVQQKFNNSREGMELLSKPEGELKAAIPGVGNAGGDRNSPTVSRLKELMGHVEAIKAERDRLEKELKEKTFDMTSVFLVALAESGAVSEEPLSLEKLNEIYGPIRTQVSQSIQQQDQLVHQIQQLNAAFTQEKAGSGAGAERERVLKMLAMAHDSFMELRANLQEGTKFYNDLTPLLVRLQQKASDFCFARKTEKEDLLNDLKQGRGGGGQAQPPPRPPPPQVQQTQAGQASAPPPAQAAANPFTGSPTTNAPPTTAPSPYPYPTTVYAQQGYPLPGHQQQMSQGGNPYAGVQQQTPYPSQPQPLSYAPGAPYAPPANTPYPVTSGFPYPMAPPTYPTGYNPYAQPYPPQQQQQGYQQQQQQQPQPYPYGQQQWRTL